MRTILTSALILGGAILALSSPAQSQVTIQTGPYWRQNHAEGEWRDRREFKESEHRRVDWQRQHCVRDWQGKEFCR
jgi:hypothetical protein